MAKPFIKFTNAIGVDEAQMIVRALLAFQPHVGSHKVEKLQHEATLAMFEHIARAHDKEGNQRYYSVVPGDKY